jgi:hypothetical protein
MSKKEKKRILFEVYSNNLKTIFDNAKNDDLPRDFGCFCPICETHFSASQYDSLSLEHNPPKSLGGKDNILTCVKCNNTAGTKIDSEILLALNELEFMKFKPNSSIKTQFHNKSTGDKGVNGSFGVDENGSIVINISPANNPKTRDNFLNSFEYEFRAFDVLQNNLENFGLNKKLSFDIKKPNRRSERLASIALLKIAYLLAYEKLGHIVMFGKHMRIVRDQIQNPEKDIITKPFWLHYAYPDSMLGINIITKPIELKSFLIVFDLVTKSDNYRIGICLPGFDEKDDVIYQNIESLVCTGEGNIDFEANNYLNSEFDIRESEKAILPIVYWEKLFEYITAHNSGLTQ